MTSFVLILNLPATADPNQDWLGIIIFGFDFVIFTLILTALFNRIANSKAAKLWPKLTPVINGVFHQGIGLTTPYVIGKYRGLPVRARVWARARSRWNFEYYFEILATSGAHGRDWELHSNQSSGEAHRWELKVKDSELKERLSQSGLMAVLSNREYGTSVKYNGDKGTLLYSRRIYTRDGLPSPEVFELQLDLVTRLVNINRTVNEERGAGNLLKG